MKNKIIIKLTAFCMSVLILMTNIIVVNAGIGLEEVKNSVDLIKNLIQPKCEDMSTEKLESLEENSKIRKQKELALKSAKKTMKISEDTDMNYIIVALNMIEPYIYKITGITENFRLYSGNINYIKIGKISRQEEIESRLYNRDDGEGSANVMRCLFPSSAGTLNSGGEISCFSKNCNPTPELISKIAKFLYNVRKDSQGIKKYLENHEKYPSKFTIQDFLKQYFDKKGEFSKGKNSKTLFCLLKNMTYMIDNEETDKENLTEEDGERILPKYTTERMLMSYFLEHFNEESQVAEFYNKVKDLIKIDVTEKINFDNSIEKLNYLVDLINKSGFNDKSPYNSTPVQNGPTKIMNLENEAEKKIKIKNETFADCADVVVRHIMNFLLYDGKKIFNLVQGGKQENLNKLIDAINNNKEIEYKSLKERLQLFYLYQTKDRVNDGSVLTRTLWNYVISNMENIDQKTSSEMYSIKYSYNKSWELKTGFINMIKLIYNLAYALKSGQGCYEAKVAIDKLNEKSSEEDLKEALEKTLKILNPGVNIAELSNFKIYKDEIYGDLKIKIDSVEFDIYQFSSHAYVEYNVLKKIDTKSDDEEKLKNNEIARLLMFKSNNDYQILNLFHRLYLGQASEIKSIYEKKSEALRFLKEFQGEENNSYRIFRRVNKDVDFLEGSKLIYINKEKSQTLFDYIFDKYIVNNIKSIKNIDDVIMSKIIKKDGLKYLIKNNNTCILYDFNDSEMNQNIKIPKKVKKDDKEYMITLVNEIAFRGCEKLKTVEFEEDSQIESIGCYAFSGCIRLKTVKILKNIKNINKGVFFRCKSLETVDFEDGSQLENIESEVFSECIRLKTIKIPQNINKIGIEAFKNCQNLEVIDFEEDSQLTSIDNYAFTGCIRLKIIKIPKNVIEIKVRVFFRCNNLKSIIVDEENMMYSSKEGILFNKDKKVLICYPGGKNDTNIYIISSNVNSISDNAFEGCIELETIEFEEDSHIENIGSYVFGGCIKLKEIKIPKSIKNIDNNAFLKCIDLEIVKFEEGSAVENIGNNAFAECVKLKEIKIPQNVKNIGINAFRKCRNLEVIEFEEDSVLKNIKNNAFAECIRLKEIKIPKNTTNIDKEAFKSCQSLQTIEFEKDSQLENIDDYAFGECIGLKTIKIPMNVKRIGCITFFGCTNLEIVEFEKGSRLESIGYNMFEKCRSLKHIIIKDESLKKIFEESAYLTFMNEL